MRTTEDQMAENYRVLKEAVEGRIASLVSRIEPKPLRDAMENNLPGGKMVRPMITILACGAVGGRVAAAIDAATAIELLHTSSLVHDDIMDDSHLRRGRAATHVVHGVPMAILAGDTFIALAFTLMQSISSPNKERINQVFASSFHHVCVGQGFDLCLPLLDDCEAGLHTRMVEKKTASLLEAAAVIGALSGTINEQQIRALALYGYNLGMAFQAKDDVLDATGAESVLGKPTRVDHRNGKITYLSLTYSGNADDSAVGDSLAPTRGLIEHFTRRACNALDDLPSSEARELLYILAHSLRERFD